VIPLSDILHFLSWYLLIMILGWIAFPIAFRFFPRLASKGYAFIKPLGLLLWGYLFWILCSLGILQNDLGGEILAFLIVIALSILALTKGCFSEVKRWVKENWKTILSVEIVFLVFFGLWTIVRAATPEITGTEKPMELAFINAILKSPSFPPQDPWLSGYAISYYYFSYVLIAMLIRLTGVLSGVGYNLTAALWFGLTAAAAFGLVFDLVAFWKRGKEKLSTSIFSEANKQIGRLAGILGSFFVLIVSNVEGLLEVLHSSGVFWTKATTGSLTSKFWSWLAIQDLSTAPTQPFNWIPSRYLVWWRGSRVLQDFGFANNGVEIIDEFPFFSYLLSDLHPHVLAMPFDIMAMGICLNLFIAGSEGLWPNWHIRDWFTRWEFWLTALVLGSMAFFNTWDFPIYVGLFCLVGIYLKITQQGWSGQRIWEFIEGGLVFGVTGAVLFLPFFLTFKSQAGGLLPSLEYMTRGVHFWVMFAPLLIPIICWLIHVWKRTETPGKWARGLKFSLILVASLWIISSLVGLLFFSAESVGNQLVNSSNLLINSIGQKLIYGGQLLSGLHGTNDGAADVLLSLTRRITQPGTWLTLTFMLALIWGLLSSGIPTEAQVTEDVSEGKIQEKTRLKAETFVLFMVLIGVALTLFPEYFYLRDQFGSRMNTIFKFYFQTWLFWGMAAAFASVVLWSELKSWKHSLFTLGWLLLISSALVYPSLMILNKTNSFQPQTWTLNGNAYIQNYRPDEALAMDWLKTQSQGIISEAVGPSYSEYARVSEQTGFPTVIGWWMHELQWRGGNTEIGSRQQDIKTLYESVNWVEAETIIDKYDIQYIYVGYLENTTYKLSLTKFAQNLKVVYQNQSVTIYEVPQEFRRVAP
jgi:YYY domain-containing protein